MAGTVRTSHSIRMGYDRTYLLIVVRPRRIMRSIVYSLWRAKPSCPGHIFHHLAHRPTRVKTARMWWGRHDHAPPFTRVWLIIVEVLHRLPLHVGRTTSDASYSDNYVRTENPHNHEDTPRVKQVGARCPRDVHRQDGVLVLPLAKVKGDPLTGQEFKSV